MTMLAKEVFRCQNRFLVKVLLHIYIEVFPRKILGYVFSVTFYQTPQTNR